MSRQLVVSDLICVPVPCRDNLLFWIIRVKFTLLLPSLHSSVGSFYAVRFVANMLVTVAAVLYSCESSGLYAMFLFVYLGVSVVGVNILGHRCV